MNFIKKKNIVAGFLIEDRTINILELVGWGMPQQKWLELILISLKFSP